jgi:hypothetical protein
MRVPSRSEIEEWRTHIDGKIGGERRYGNNFVICKERIGGAQYVKCQPV